MSKSNIRKITVDTTKCNIDSRRPSVFERLGTKPAATGATQNSSDYCRNWALNGNCSYGKSCKYANTHTLISPSKRIKKDNASTNPSLLIEDPFKRLTSKIVKTTSHSPDLNIDEWNQTDLEYEDEKVLERRRQLLQRELELQMKKDKEVHGKEKIKYKKKAMSSSSSSHSSSSSTSSSTSSSDDSSSSSTSDSRKKIKKFKKTKHSTSPEFDEDKDRRRKLKLKRLGSKNDKLSPKKKRKIDVSPMKDIPSKSIEKSNSAITAHKHISTLRAKSPLPSISHVASIKPKSTQDRIRSESPKLRLSRAGSEKDRHQRKLRETEELSLKEMTQKKSVDRIERGDRVDRLDRMDRLDRLEKIDRLERLERDRLDRKEPDKSRPRPSDLDKLSGSGGGGSSSTGPSSAKSDDRSKGPRSRDKDSSRRSRTPERSKHQPHQSHPKELSRPRRSRSSDKPRPRHEPLPPPPPPPPPSGSGRHTDKGPGGSSRSREHGRRERERSRDREQQAKLKHHQNSSSSASSSPLFGGPPVPGQEDQSSSSRRAGPDYSGRQRSKERPRGEREERARERDREERREREPGKRDRDRERERERERERLAGPSDGKSGRGGYKEPRPSERGKERPGGAERERGKERAGGPPERERNKDRGGSERERDRDREREHLQLDRERQRRYKPGSGAAGAGLEGRGRDSPARREYERAYGRLLGTGAGASGHHSEPHPRHWDETEEQQQQQPAASEYRESAPDERRKSLSDSRRYDSPFAADRRAPAGLAAAAGVPAGPPEDRSQARYPDRGAPALPVPQQQPPPPPGPPPASGPFEPEPLLHHPIIRAPNIREEPGTDSWPEVHHDLERPYGAGNGDWEERDWRPGGRPMWPDREGLPPPRSEPGHEDEPWSGGRYDNSISDWKSSESSRKWDSQSALHGRSSYRNERIKELELADPALSKRRPFSTPERREDLPSHAAKQALHNSMKDEPINKKLMELAEGRPRRSREKSADSFHRKSLAKEKPVEVKEIPVVTETKRACLDEPLPPIQHTESDLSDISDDPDDILNMEEEVIENKYQANKSNDVERDSTSVKSQDMSHPSPKPPIDDTLFTKEKDTTETYSNKNNMEDESMENMDFEEISDGELEEDIKTSCKGLGDALGVDWESLVRESQPRRPIGTSHDNAQDRWQCKAVFQRIGISVKAAGHEFVDKLLKKYMDNESNKLLLHDVAFVHTALARKQFMPNSTYKLINNDDFLYRTKSEVDIDDTDNLKPCTNLYEEAKMLLQQQA